MAITRAQIARQLYQFGGGADMGRERGPETGREPGPVGGGQGVRGDTPRGDGPATSAPSQGLIGEIRRQQLEKAPDIVERQKFNVLNFIPGIGLIRRLSNILPPGGKPFDANRFPGGGGGGGSQAMATIPMWMQLGFNSEAEYLASLEQDKDKDKEAEEGLRLAFKADGGPIGGEFDFESARQMYGLGKLVKKVTRTVKKIAKSPVGKAALAGATIKFGGPLAAKFAPGTFGSAAKSPFLRAIGRGQFFGDTGIFSAGRNLLFGTDAGIRSLPGLLDKFPGGGVGALIAGTSLLAGALTPKQEDEAQQLAAEEGIDIEAARNSILARARGNIRGDYRMLSARAEGGPAEGKEPVAKKTMPLLDMGGQEMDLRAEGGFVPIGRMEKADDVPARLSKNEFVFTADAVRNAGDGNVDKGAEVMYNMMKNLEAGGDVSEESQGLKGARKMFQTSQRLEEVL